MQTKNTFRRRFRLTVAILMTIALIVFIIESIVSIYYVPEIKFEHVQHVQGHRYILKQVVLTIYGKELVLMTGYFNRTYEERLYKFEHGPAFKVHSTWYPADEGTNTAVQRLQENADPSGLTTGTIVHGFGVSRYDFDFDPPAPADEMKMDANTQTWVVPIWAPLLLLAVATGLAWRKPLVERSRRKAGKCIACGFDLRASRERCPECGLPIRSQKAPSIAPPHLGD